MSVDFQQLRSQISILGDQAPHRAKQVTSLWARTVELLEGYATQVEWLNERVEQIAKVHDPNLRCALPVVNELGQSESLDGTYPRPYLRESATVIAADGSQIAPDRHMQVNYCLINLGAIRMRYDSNQAAEVFVETRLYHDDMLYTEYGIISEARLALMRDLNERQFLLGLANKSRKPVVTFTDGPMELWGSRDTFDTAGYQQSLDEYLRVLEDLSQLGVTTAGYVDKPGANLVVRLLELASLAEDELEGAKRNYPLRGVTDFWLFQELLKSGERSAVFAIRSKSANSYLGDLRLHFFYLNVGYPENPWIARIEIPAWVARSKDAMDRLHAVLIDQCRIMGPKAYPYLLHRAHETALVTHQEKEQVTAMIVRELHKRGVTTVGMSHKQSAKGLAGRTRYKG